MANVIVLMGPQGSGKGTQAKMMAATYSLPIVATGDMLREVAKRDDSLGYHVRLDQAMGRLVSDDLLAEIVSERTSQPDCRGGYVLDGFPRTLPQVHHLEKIAGQQGHVIAVIKISINRDLLNKRLTGRLNCPVCGAVYNTHFQPSQKEGICDNDGAALVIRADDNQEAIAKRLELYDEKTKPLVEYYKETGRLYRVDGNGSPEEVFARIRAVVSGLGQPMAAGPEVH